MKVENMKDKKFLKYILHMFFPKRCIICDKIINFDEINCMNCDKILEEISIFKKDILKIEKYKFTTYCYSSFSYDNIIRTAILNFKFNHRKDNMYYFTNVILNLFKYSKIEIDNFDCLIHVPSTPSKDKYNHLEYLCKNISKELKIPLYKNALFKQKGVKKQHKLNLKQRKLNIINAFYFNEKINLKNKSVILIDDIITSGSTLKECIKCLLDNGAKDVICFTLAKTYIFS